jgi:hypothetical protein
VFSSFYSPSLPRKLRHRRPSPGNLQPTKPRPSDLSRRRSPVTTYVSERFTITSPFSITFMQLPHRARMECPCPSRGVFLGIEVGRDVRSVVLTRGRQGADAVAIDGAVEDLHRSAASGATYTVPLIGWDGQTTSG